MGQTIDPTIHAGELILEDPFPSLKWQDRLEQDKYEQDPAQCGDSRYL